MVRIAGTDRGDLSPQRPCVGGRGLTRKIRTPVHERQAEAHVDAEQGPVIGFIDHPEHLGARPAMAGADQPGRAARGIGLGDSDGPVPLARRPGPVDGDIAVEVHSFAARNARQCSSRSAMRFS